MNAKKRGDNNNEGAPLVCRALLSLSLSTLTKWQNEQKLTLPSSSPLPGGCAHFFIKQNSRIGGDKGWMVDRWNCLFLFSFLSSNKHDGWLTGFFLWQVDHAEAGISTPGNRRKDGMAMRSNMSNKNGYKEEASFLKNIHQRRIHRASIAREKCHQQFHEVGKFGAGTGGKHTIRATGTGSKFTQGNRHNGADCRECPGIEQIDGHDTKEETSGWSCCWQGHDGVHPFHAFAFVQLIWYVWRQ